MCKIQPEQQGTRKKYQALLFSVAGFPYRRIGVHNQTVFYLLFSNEHKAQGKWNVCYTRDVCIYENETCVCVYVGETEQERKERVSERVCACSLAIRVQCVNNPSHKTMHLTVIYDATTRLLLAYEDNQKHIPECVSSSLMLSSRKLKCTLAWGDIPDNALLYICFFFVFWRGNIDFMWGQIECSSVRPL